MLDLLGDGGRLVPVDARLDLGINLIGGADDLLPYLIYALRLAGDLGLGPGRGHGRGRFRLLAVSAEPTLGSDRWQPVWQAEQARYEAIEPMPVALPPAPARATVALRTPLRLQRRGALLGPADLTAAEFLRHLCYRLDQLELLYGLADAPLWWPHHRALIEGLAAAPPGSSTGAPTGPPMGTQLHWHDQTRWSSRQQQSMKLGGLLGRLPLPAAGLDQLWPLLWFGQYVHLGKNTSFGLGQYRVLTET